MLTCWAGPSSTLHKVKRVDLPHSSLGEHDGVGKYCDASHGHAVTSATLPMQVEIPYPRQVRFNPSSTVICLSLFFMTIMALTIVPLVDKRRRQAWLNKLMSEDYSFAVRFRPPNMLAFLP